MKSFRDILAEAAIRVNLTPASKGDQHKLEKILDGGEVSYKQKKDTYAIIFDDKLQKDIVMSAIKNDRKIKFK